MCRELAATRQPRILRWVSRCCAIACIRQVGKTACRRFMGSELFVRATLVAVTKESVRQFVGQESSSECGPVMHA